MSYSSLDSSDKLFYGASWQQAEVKGYANYQEDPEALNWLWT